MKSSSSLIARLLFSSHRPGFLSTSRPLSPSSLATRSYSSAHRRSPERRGGRRGFGDEDKSEDYFLRNLNFGDSGSGNGSGDREAAGDEDGNRADRGISASGTDRPMRDEMPIRGDRPMRGERPIRGDGPTRGDRWGDGPGSGGGDDLFARYGEGRGRRDDRRGSGSEVRDRYARGQRRERGGSFRDGFDSGGPRRSNANFEFDRLDDGEVGKKDDYFGGFSDEKLELGDEKGAFEDDDITSKRDMPKESVIHNLKFSREPELEPEPDSSPEKNPKETANPESAPDASTQGEDSPAIPDSSKEEANAIFKQLKETGLVPHAVAMLDGLCKDGLVHEAMKLFGKMREKGSIPEVVIYTAVVQGFCKATKYEDAKRIFRKMQKNGIVPNPYSYKVIVEGLYKGKQLEDSIEYCLEMLDAGHPVSVGTFTGLVDCVCRQKGVEEAERVIKGLRERNLAVDDKAVKEHLDRKGPFSPLVWEAIFGKKTIGRML